jgi:hypothetical protein
VEIGKRSLEVGNWKLGTGNWKLGLPVSKKSMLGGAVSETRNWTLETRN